MVAWVLIPVKPFHLGKSRLAGILNEVDRIELNRRLFDLVLAAVLDAVPAECVAVVSRDLSLLAALRTTGVHPLKEPGSGLNEALEYGASFARDNGATVVAVIPSDLYLLESQDVKALIQRGADAKACVIAPDQHEQGTNALLLAPARSSFYRFGPDSFAAHIAAARKERLSIQILRRRALRYDLDTPGDYEQYLLSRS
jgi:2-phospho-L-lactate/phosphoenolpyruvate guanylyltransferase